MKILLIIGIIACSFGCLTPNPSASSSKQPSPPLIVSTLTVKSCEEILEEESKNGWRKYEVVSTYPSFLENLDFTDKVVGDLSTCIIGKNKEFVTKILGEPSNQSIGIFKYHIYKDGEKDLMKAKCLIFRMKDGKSISSVTYEDCNYKRQ